LGVGDGGDVGGEAMNMTISLLLPLLVVRRSLGRRWREGDYDCYGDDPSSSSLLYRPLITIPSSLHVYVRSPHETPNMQSLPSDFCSHIAGGGVSF
jgi:hypothetical protein